MVLQVVLPHPDSPKAQASPFYLEMGMFTTLYNVLLFKETEKFSTDNRNFTGAHKLIPPFLPLYRRYGDLNHTGEFRSCVFTNVEVKLHRDANGHPDISRVDHRVDHRFHTIF